MYGGIKGWFQFDPTDELLVPIDRCQNTHCTDADWSGPSSSGGSCPVRLYLGYALDQDASWEGGKCSFSRVMSPLTKQKQQKRKV